MSDDPLLHLCNQREEHGAVQTQALDKVGLIGLAESVFVDEADRRPILRSFAADAQTFLRTHLLDSSAWRSEDGSCKLDKEFCGKMTRRTSLILVGIVATGAIAVTGVGAQRKRPPMPKITKPVLFGTPEADRILTALQVFPPDNPWNQDISGVPVHKNSAQVIASIGAETHLGYNLDMNFVIVPPDQKRIPVKILLYPADSDPGPFPVPDNAPIENWPLARNEDTRALPRPGQTLDGIQRHGTGDRHLLIVDPGNGKLHEFWQARKTDAGWEASNAATFDLRTGALRPEGWTSADAAGLPIFPASVRYDECERGLVEHAMRVTVRRTQRAYVLPATHFASRHTDPNLPRMGERLRLRRDFDTSGFPRHARAILEGLKKYGMFVADNGQDWLMSISPDGRLQGLETLGRVKGSDFEVVDTGARSGNLQPGRRP